MRLLSRYLLRQLVAPFLFGLAALTSLMLLSQIAKKFGALVGKGLPWGVIAEVFALSLPFIVAMTLPMARDLATELRKQWSVDFDDAGAIGRRYRRQDEVGTPYCITVDFDSLEDHAVTVRERDSMAQERIALAQVTAYLNDHLPPC